jgi:hypothetical protein
MIDLPSKKIIIKEKKKTAIELLCPIPITLFSMFQNMDVFCLFNKFLNFNQIVI